MTLGPGSRLGPYEIVAPLGAGGMGQVYRARDTRLGRDVAIKVVSSHLASDHELLTRFEREAKAVAALSHPNILAIHDVGTHNGTAYAVMELLDGQTLRARLSEGRLPARKAIEISLQMADGLAAAHDKGIVHRDLKPDNVFLTRDGHVKILDFGLAKLQATAQDGATSAPTELAGTVPGVVMGTAGYMAPEQVRGQNADHRADLFAFGAIVYEMLAGTRAFKGDSAVETMNAILKDDPPDVPTSGAMVSAALDRVVRRCLEKNPDERFQSARDLAFALRAVSGFVDSGSSAAVAFKDGSRAAGARPYAVGGVIGAALASAIAAALWLAGPAPVVPQRRVVRFTLEIPVGRALQSFALAPDGSRLAYVATEGGQPRIYVRGLDQGNDVALAGTEGAIAPFFSPDSQWIAFFAAGRLRKVAAQGGEVLSIAEAPFSGVDTAREPTGTWAGETIIFSVGGRGLMRVPASGGSTASVTAPSGEEGDVLHLWPHVPSGGTTALFTVSNSGDYDIASVDSVPLGGGPRTRAIAIGAHAIHIPTGHVVYAAGGQLVTARFDAGSQTAAADRVVLVDFLGYRDKEPLFDVSAAGDLVYAEAPLLPMPDLLRVDRQGREESLRGPVPGLTATLNLSLDGTRLVGYRGSRERRFFLWMLDLQRGIQTQIPIDGNPHVPVWLPDGRTLAFSSDRAGPFNLFLQPADGNGPAERLTDSPLHEDPGNWSRDGQWLTYTAVDSKTGTDLWAYDRTVGRGVPVRQSPANERFPALSPDGRWLAYASDESDREEVYVEAFPGGAGRVQLSGDGGTEPVWSATGQEIFYRSGTRLMSVTVQTGTTLSASSPVPLFAGTFDPGNSYGPPGYAVAPDGQHFYFLRGSSISRTPSRIHVVLNWIDEFKRRIAK